MYPEDWLALPELAASAEVFTLGRSAIVNPMGEIIAGPLEGTEGILTAEIDLAEIPRAKFDFDVTGHYARSDIFHLVVDRRPKPAVSWISAPENESVDARHHRHSFVRNADGE
jgi:nitrilase